jgi:hypothetical protein
MQEGISAAKLKQNLLDDETTADSPATVQHLEELIKAATLNVQNDARTEEAHHIGLIGKTQQNVTQTQPNEVANLIGQLQRQQQEFRTSIRQTLKPNETQNNIPTQNPQQQQYTQNQTYSTGSGRQPMSTLTCFGCGTRGHMRKDCRKSQNNWNQQRNFQGGYQGRYNNNQNNWQRNYRNTQNNWQGNRFGQTGSNQQQQDNNWQNNTQKNSSTKKQP